MDYIKHINNGRSFYRVKGDDTSIVLKLPENSRVLDEKNENTNAGDKYWFEEHWRMLNKNKFRILYWNVDSFINMNYIERLKSINRINDWDILVLVEAGKEWSNELLVNLSDNFEGKHWSKPYLVDGTEQGILIMWRKQLLKFESCNNIIRKDNGENFTSGLVVLSDFKGNKLTIVGLHLKSWPSKGKCYSELRLKQIENINTMITENYKGELLVVGDFNHPIDYHHSPPEYLKTRFKLNNVFDKKKIYHPKDSTIYNDTWLVDYAFISNNIEICEQIPTTLDFYKAMGDLNKPSDHFPLSFSIKFN